MKTTGSPEYRAFNWVPLHLKVKWKLGKCPNALLNWLLPRNHLGAHKAHGTQGNLGCSLKEEPGNKPQRTGALDEVFRLYM